MPDEKLVSVVIPSYNRTYCTAKAIESVFAQTHPNFEIIVLDDDSKDMDMDSQVAKQ